MIRAPRGCGRDRFGGRGGRPVSLADAAAFRGAKVKVSDVCSSDSFIDRGPQRLLREASRRVDGETTVTSADSLNLLKTQEGSSNSAEICRLPPARPLLAACRPHWRSFSASTGKAGTEAPGVSEAPPASMQRVFALPLETAADPSGRPRFIDETTVRFYEGRSAMVPVVFALSNQVFRGDYAPDPLLQSLQAAQVVEGRSSARWSGACETEGTERSVVSDGKIEKLLMSYNKAKAQDSRSEEWDGRLPSISHSNGPYEDSVESDTGDGRPLMTTLPAKEAEGNWLLPSNTADSDSSRVDVHNVEPGGGRVTNFAASNLSLDTATTSSSQASSGNHIPAPFHGRVPSTCQPPRRVLRKSRVSLLGKPIRSVFPNRRQLRFNNADHNPM